MPQIFGGHAVREDSPVWISQGDFYSDQWAIQFDYAKARDLMRSEGYSAADTNVFPQANFDFEGPTIIVPEGLILNLYSVLLGLIVLTVFGKKNKWKLSK